MSADPHQSLRGFVSTLERAHPDLVVRIVEPVDQAYQMQALALELERRRRFPVLFFEQVRGHAIWALGELGAAEVLAGAQIFVAVELQPQYNPET